jgi:Beta-lactamase enzyme family
VPFACEAAGVEFVLVSGEAAEGPFVQDADAVFAAASLDKLPIAICAAKLRGYATGAHADVDVGAVRGFAYSRQLASVQTLSLSAALRSAIRDSDNQAANALIRAAGIDRINEFSRALGLTETRIHDFYRDSSSGIPCTTSAQDMRRLLVELVAALGGKSSLIEQRVAVSIVEFMSENDDDASIIRRAVPRCATVAIKQGETSEVLHEVGIIDPYIDPIVVCLLTRSRPVERPALSSQLSNFVFSRYSKARREPCLRTG